MESSTDDFDDSMFFESSYALGLLLCFKVSMTELAFILTGLGTTPSIEITVLITCCIVMISAIYVDSLEP